MSIVDANRVIGHIDCNAFYAQVEMLRNPQYANSPLAVQQQTLIVTSNYIARRMGVKKMCSVGEALQVCPSLVLIPSNMNRYKLASAKILQDLTKFGLVVEKSSIDDMYLDLTPFVDIFFHLFPDSNVASTIASSNQLSSNQNSKNLHDLEDDSEEWSNIKATSSSSSGQNIKTKISQTRLRLFNTHILPHLIPNPNIFIGYLHHKDTLLKSTKQNPLDLSFLNPPLSIFDKRLCIGTQIMSIIRISLELNTGYQTSAGIAHNVFISKVASDVKKPNAQTVIFLRNVEKLLESMSLDLLPGIGRATIRSIQNNPLLFHPDNTPQLNEIIQGAVGMGFSEDQPCLIQSLKQPIPPRLVKDMYKFPIETLNLAFGKQTGTWLYDLVRGIDHRPVKWKQAPKQIGVEGWWKPCTTLEQIEACLNRHSRELLIRLGMECWVWATVDGEHQTCLRRPKTLVVKWHVTGSKSSTFSIPFPTCPVPMPKIQDWDFDPLTENQQAAYSNIMSRDSLAVSNQKSVSNLNVDPEVSPNGSSTRQSDKDRWISSITKSALRIFMQNGPKKPFRVDRMGLTARNFEELKGTREISDFLGVSTVDKLVSMGFPLNSVKRLISKNEELSFEELLDKLVGKNNEKVATPAGNSVKPQLKSSMKKTKRNTMVSHIDIDFENPPSDAVLAALPLSIRSEILVQIRGYLSQKKKKL